MRGFAAIGLVNVKFEGNVGAVLRAAGCYSASLVAVSGTRYHYSRQDTQKAHRHMPVIESDDLFSVMPIGAIPVAIEINDRARSLVDYVHPEQAFYIFGPEDGSIPDEIIVRCRDVVSVPTKYCMNLAATVNVVLYDRIAKATGTQS